LCVRSIHNYIHDHQNVDNSTQSDANESYVPQPVSGQEDIELALRLSEMSEEEAFQFAMKESTSPRITGICTYIYVYICIYI
jgi:hypothetical protein